MELQDGNLVSANATDTTVPLQNAIVPVEASHDVAAAMQLSGLIGSDERRLDQTVHHGLDSLSLLSLPVVPRKL